MSAKHSLIKDDKTISTIETQGKSRDYRFYKGANETDGRPMEKKVFV